MHASIKLNAFEVSNNLYTWYSSQELKDLHFAEHKRLMDMLDTDREQILIEKTKLETMERIKPTVSKESTKRHTEIDAAIKIAQVLLVVCSF